MWPRESGRPSAKAKKYSKAVREMQSKHWMKSDDWRKGQQDSYAEQLSGFGAIFTCYTHILLQYTGSLWMYIPQPLWGSSLLAQFSVHPISEPPEPLTLDGLWTFIRKKNFTVFHGWGEHIYPLYAYLRVHVCHTVTGFQSKFRLYLFTLFFFHCLLLDCLIIKHIIYTLFAGFF